MRQRLFSGLAVAMLATVGVLTGAPAASAEPAGITATCGGWTLVYQRDVVLTNPTHGKVGTIQLCRRSTDNTYFGRIEMDNPLPSGRFANAFLYYNTSTGRYFVSCDDNVNGGHVLPGGRICYTSSITNTSTVWNLNAIGRAYYRSGSSWILYASGGTPGVN